MNSVHRERRHLQLAAVYLNMPTDEIKRRIAEGSLIPLAREVAESELEKRANPPTEEPERTGNIDADQGEAAIFFAVAGLIGLAIGWFLMPNEYFFLMLAILIPSIAIPFGKRFPRVGLAVGGVFVVLPVAFSAWLWNRGDLDFAHKEVIEVIIVSVILLFLFSFSWGIGASLIYGANFRGSWSELNRDIQKRRDGAMSSLKKMD